MNPAIAMPEAPRKGRGRLQLLLILAIAIGPMFLASAMYQWRFWVPETRSYHGVLIGDGRTLLSQVCTFLYFAYFILMPFYTRMEKTKPVPERVTG